ncbi:MAG TPA: hypothetical protein VG253_28545 [Streptosporangiaceae bacterium]|nr:hypothetical protein [Streptosporangiaceae bacterium]
MITDWIAVVIDCMATEVLVMADRCNGMTRKRSMIPRSISSRTPIPLHMLVDRALITTTPGTR